MAKHRLEILAPAWKELDEKIASYHLMVVGYLNIIQTFKALKKLGVFCYAPSNKTVRS